MLETHVADAASSSWWWSSSSLCPAAVPDPSVGARTPVSTSPQVFFQGCVAAALCCAVLLLSSAFAGRLAQP